MGRRRPLSLERLGLVPYLVMYLVLLLCASSQQPHHVLIERERERKKRRVKLTYRTTGQDIEAEIYSIIIIIHDEKCHEERKKNKRLSWFNPVSPPHTSVLFGRRHCLFFLFFLNSTTSLHIISSFSMGEEWGRMEWIIYSSSLFLPFSHTHTRISSRAGMRSPPQSSLDSTHDIFGYFLFSRCVGLKFGGKKKKKNLLFVNISYM